MPSSAFRAFCFELPEFHEAIYKSGARSRFNRDDADADTNGSRISVVVLEYQCPITHFIHVGKWQKFQYGAPAGVKRSLLSYIRR